jgi:hypothetical protein
MHRIDPPIADRWVGIELLAEHLNTLKARYENRS